MFNWFGSAKKNAAAKSEPIPGRMAARRSEGGNPAKCAGRYDGSKPESCFNRSLPRQ